MGRLEGKVALITGAARGQGAAEARLFAAEGARVAVTDVLDAEGQAVARDLGSGAGEYWHLDVTSEGEWSSVVRGVVERFGRLDVLVNNAGIVKGAPIAAMSLDDYMDVVRVNQVGVFLGMRSCIPHLAAAGGASIVNVSSVDGMVGMAGVVAYVASKWAVRGMTKTAALELGSLGIRVNSIHPGGIDTPMLRPDAATGDFLVRYFSGVPAGRVGTPEDVAKLALFLASDDAAYCTGSEFVVDGGLIAGVSTGS